MRKRLQRWENIRDLVPDRPDLGVGGPRPGRGLDLSNFVTVTMAKSSDSEPLGRLWRVTTHLRASLTIEPWF